MDTSADALAVSIGERARVDLGYMAQLTGKSEEDIVQELTGVIFRIPGTDAQYVTADEYLSGNVRQKLREARTAAQSDAAFQPNVTALEAAQPKDLEASDIDVRLGATWIAPEYIQEFMYELLNTPYYQRRAIEVHFSPHTAEWRINGKNVVSRSNVAAYTTYGTDRANAYKILEDTLNLRDVRIYDTVQDADGREQRVLNQKATTLAQQKQQAMSIPKFSRVVSRDEIRSNDYNLNIPRYVDSSEAAEHWDVYASMFGGIPTAEIDELGEYWTAFPHLRGQLFTQSSTPYVSVAVDDIRTAIKQSSDVVAFENAYGAAFASFAPHLKSVLISRMEQVEIAKTESALSDDIFLRLSGIPLIDKYTAYQMLDDQWRGIAVDLEMIQTEGFAAVKKVDPHLVIKKKFPPCGPGM